LKGDARHNGCTCGHRRDLPPVALLSHPRHHGRRDGVQWKEGEGSSWAAVGRSFPAANGWGRPGSSSRTDAALDSVFSPARLSEGGSRTSRLRAEQSDTVVVGHRLGLLRSCVSAGACCEANARRAKPSGRGARYRLGSCASLTSVFVRGSLLGSCWPLAG
jgi:hypothetical protein